VRSRRRAFQKTEDATADVSKMGDFEGRPQGCIKLTSVLNVLQNVATTNHRDSDTNEAMTSVLKCCQHFGPRECEYGESCRENLCNEMCCMNYKLRRWVPQNIHYYQVSGKLSFSAYGLCIRLGQPHPMPKGKGQDMKSTFTINPTSASTGGYTNELVQLF